MRIKYDEAGVVSEVLIVKVKEQLGEQE